MTETCLFPAGPLPDTYLVSSEDLFALLRDRERLARLERYLQLGRSSVFHACSAPEPLTDEDFQDDGVWSGRYTIGHQVEEEHRGCYRFETLGEHRRLGPAIDLAMDAWEKQCAEYRKAYRKATGEQDE